MTVEKRTAAVVEEIVSIMQEADPVQTAQLYSLIHRIDGMLTVRLMQLRCDDNDLAEVFLHDADAEEKALDA
jgi:hypothetical protein